MPPRTVVLANLGTPAAPTPEAVRAFLAEFLSDREVVDFPRLVWLPLLHGVILRKRPPRVAELYRGIWWDEGSPLDVETRRMAAALGARLGPETTVDVAYRYGAPSVAGALAAAAARGGDTVLIPLFPQRTGATTGTLEEVVRREAARAGLGGRCAVRIPAPDDAGYVAALTARTRAALATVSEPVQQLVVSFHGIPVRYDTREGGRYTAECRRTTDALVAALGWDPARATLAYQSRFGPGKWLTPATADVFTELPRRKVEHVAVITPGFLTDGLETLEEIGITGRESFHAAGGRTFVRVPAVADEPSMIEGLARLALAPL